MFKMNPIYCITSNKEPFPLIELVHSSFSEIEKCIPVFQMQIAYNIKSIRMLWEICLVACFTPFNMC